MTESKPKTTTVKHPVIDNLTQEVPTSDLTAWKDQGWKVAAKAEQEKPAS